MKYLILFFLVFSCLFLGNQSFVDKVIHIKGMKLSQSEETFCKRFVFQEKVRSPYLNALHFTFEKQVKMKLGDATFSRSFLDHKVDVLMRNFLKEKLQLTHPLKPEVEMAKKAKWDPHYHAASLYAAKFSESIFLLPNFDLAYLYMRQIREKKPIDFLSFVLNEMKGEDFSTITETSCVDKKWQLECQGKKCLPLLSHKRDWGSAPGTEMKGYDLCGPENESSYQSMRIFLESLPSDKVVRVHMGETLIPKRGKDNVKELLDEIEKYYHGKKPLRIGHGTHISLDDMLRVAQKGYFIEACLTSNQLNGVIEERSDYPLGVMLLLGIKVVIGTDGGPLYGTNLALEYAHAKHNLENFCEKLQNSDEIVTLPTVINSQRSIWI